MKLPMPNISEHSQFIIDYLEKLSDDLNEELHENDSLFYGYPFNLKEVIRANLYKIENLVEIIDPVRVKDISILTKCIKILTNDLNNE